MKELREYLLEPGDLVFGISPDKQFLPLEVISFQMTQNYYFHQIAIVRLINPKNKKTIVIDYELFEEQVWCSGWPKDLSINLSQQEYNSLK